MNKKSSVLIAIICILTLASTTLLIFNVLASPSVDANTVLGTTSNFAIVAGTTITFGDATTHVVGNLAISPNAMSSVVIPAGITMVGVGPNAYGVSSQVTGYIYADDGSPTISGNAQADCLTAYTLFNGWAPTSSTNYADLSGLTLNAGVYRDTANELLTTTLVLNGSSTDVWVFQIYGTFAVASGAQIILIGGAQASNIYWIVSGQTTVYPGAIFNGNVLDGTSIDVQTGAQFIGRALAQAAVTMGGAVSITYPEPTPLTNTPTFYATPDGSVRLRSSVPFNFTTTNYNYTQQLLVNGDIISNLTNFGPSIPYADLGFGYTYGLLGSIVLVNDVTQSPPWGTSNVPIYGNGTFYIYAYFDTVMAGDINGNGPFFAWTNNAYLGLNGDEYGSLGPFTCNIANNYTVYITPETPIDMMSGANIGENFTLSQLQNGQPNANGFYQTDVTSNTIVGFWFGVTNETYSQQFEIYTTAPAYIAPISTPTATPTSTPTPTPTSTPTPTPTATPTSTPTPTATPTSTPTPTATPTSTPTPTPLTRTSIITASPRPTSMPASTSTPIATTSPVPISSTPALTSRPLTSTLTPTLFFVTLTVTDCVFAAVMISAAHIFAQKRLRDRQVLERTQK